MGNKTSITLKAFCEMNHKKYLLAEWDYGTNTLTPEDVTFGSEKMVNWICALNHSFTQRILCRTRQKQGCPYCANKKLLSGFNDLATKFPEIAADWSEENELPASQMLCGTNKYAKWKCHICGYKWSAKVESRTGKAHTGCPMCAGAVLVKGKNDLLSQFPDVAKEWDYNQNGKNQMRFLQRQRNLHGGYALHVGILLKCQYLTGRCRTKDVLVARKDFRLLFQNKRSFIM